MKPFGSMTSLNVIMIVAVMMLVTVFITCWYFQECILRITCWLGLKQLLLEVHT